MELYPLQKEIDVRSEKKHESNTVLLLLLFIAFLSFIACLMIGLFCSSQQKETILPYASGLIFANILMWCNYMVSYFSSLSMSMSIEYKEIDFIFPLSKNWKALLCLIGLNQLLNFEYKHLFHAYSKMMAIHCCKRRQ